MLLRTQSNVRVLLTVVWKNAYFWRDVLANGFWNISTLKHFIVYVECCKHSSSLFACKMEAESLGHNTKNLLTDSKEHFAIISRAYLFTEHSSKVDEVQRKGKI